MIENVEQRTAIYIPAYSDGLTKLFYNNTDKDIANYELSDFKDKKSLRIYGDGDTYFKNPWMLISAGVQYLRTLNFDSIFDTSASSFCRVSLEFLLNIFTLSVIYHLLLVPTNSSSLV